MRTEPAFALSPDGRALAVARLDGRVELIDAETLRRTASFEAFPGRSAVAIDYSADGRRLAVAGEVAASGSGTPSRESSSARSFALPGAPDAQPANRLGARLRPGRSARRGGGGGAVRIWDLGRRELLRAPLRLPPSVHGLAFSPDGSQLAIPFGASPARVPTESRYSTSEAASGLPGFHRRRGRLGCLLPRRQPARGWRGRRRRAPLGDRRLAAGGRSARSPEHVVHSPSGVLPGRAHTCDLTLGPLGGALGRRLAGADRAPPDRHDRRTWGRDPGDGAIHPRRRPPFRGIRSRGAIRWEVDPAAWRRQACRLMGGDLTPEEWEEIAPEHDYVEVCPSG